MGATRSPRILAEALPPPGRWRQSEVAALHGAAKILLGVVNFPPTPSSHIGESARMSVSPDQLYEQTLVVRAQIGDEAAFEELLQRHGPRLHQFTQRMMQSSPELVPDLIQETWVAIYQGLPELLDPSKFRAWAFRIARDRIYRTWRKRRFTPRPIEELSENELPATEDPPEPACREELQLGLKALTPEHREALLLRYFEDLSYEEISRVTGSTVGTVRSRIFYAKQALKTYITTHHP